MQAKGTNGMINKNAQNGHNIMQRAPQQATPGISYLIERKFTSLFCFMQGLFPITLVHFKLLQKLKRTKKIVTIQDYHFSPEITTNCKYYLNGSRLY
jgi:hypothetical protein